jgi:hypothetical protein
MSKWIKITGLALLGVLVIMQFFGIDKTNPPIDKSQEFLALTSPPAEVADLLKAACYDCHSHEAKYPWYTNIAPVSWWIASHIEHGREELNFSTWGTYEAAKAAHKAEEAAEEITEKHMPITPYLIAHSEAKLSDDQRERLANWFLALADKRDITEKVRDIEVEPGPAIEEEEHSHEGHNHDDHNHDH